MEVELPLVDNMKCKTAYAMEKSALIDNTVICAGYIKGDEDSCQVFNSFDFNNFCRKRTKLFIYF